MEKKYGKTFKKIRTSKNYPQKDVNENVMHQTSYSKFELGKTDVTFEKFETLLNNLEVSYEEFLFIHNGYCYSDREEIINKFNDLKFIEVSKLYEIISLAEKYLEDQGDRYLADILAISKAFLILKETEEFEKPREYAEEVWARLQKLNTWYLSDLKLINSILFLFPISTAITITEFAIKQALKYKEFNDYRKLILPFKFNLVHMLIRENRVKEAFIVNEEVIQEAKELKVYIQIAISLLRKGIMFENNPDQSKLHVEKAFQISELLEDPMLNLQLKNERKYLSSILSSFRNK